MLVLGDGAAGFWNPLGEAQVLIASVTGPALCRPVSAESVGLGFLKWR